LSTPSNPYVNLKAEANRHRLSFIKSELVVCFTFSTIAAQKYELGNQESAVKSIANAEKAYETVVQVLSHSKHSKHLTVEEIGDTTAELQCLRGRLDRLQQLRK
jgi:hypothetical protein